MKLVLATNNQDKIREIKQVLEGLPVEILTSKDFEEFPDPDEIGDTLEDNAIIKASEVAQFCDMAAMADDSGLEVDALDGAPGVFSSRFAGPGCTYRDNNEKLLKDLDGVPEDKRTARFRCVIAIVWPDGLVTTVEGTAEGVISEDIAGREGFGYDPVFYFPPAGKRFSEMTMDEKNAVSHRGKAVAAAAELITQRLAE